MVDPGAAIKLNAVPGDRFLFQRSALPLLWPRSAETADRKGTDSMEVRQPFMCGRCNVTVAYQHTAPPAGSGPFLYILKGAMTELYVSFPPDPLKSFKSDVPGMYD